MVEGLPCSIKPIVFFPLEGRAADAYRRHGLSVEVVPVRGFLTHYEKSLVSKPLPTKLLAFGRDFAPFLLRTVCALRQKRAHLLHCNDPRSLVLFGPAARLLGIPVVWHVRGQTSGSNLVSMIAEWCVAHAIVVARPLMEEVPRSVPTSVVYNSVDVPQGDEGIGKCSHHAECRPQNVSEGSNSHESLRILTASSLTPYKGLHHAIEAVGILCRRSKMDCGIQLLVAGEPEGELQQKYFHKLKLLVKDAGLEEKVRFIGWQEHISDILAYVDLTVLPTVEYERVALLGGQVVEAQCMEGLPRVLLESMASGVPVIATDVAGVRDLVDHGRNGLLVAPGSALELARSIESLWSDSERRLFLGFEAKEVAKKFSDQRTLLGTVLVYNHVYRRFGTAGKGGRPPNEGVYTQQGVWTQGRRDLIARRRR